MDDLNEQEKLIQGHADRMTAKGVPEKQIDEFIQRAMGRLQQNEADRPLSRGQLVKGMARGVAQGATFNFADELEGLARSAFSDDTYDDAVGKVRGEQNEFRDKEKGLALASEIGGSLVPGMGLARLATKGAKGLSLAARVGASGAGGGAVAGAGAGEGSLADRAPGAIGGGIAGGALGYAGGKLIQGLQKAAPVVADASRRLVGRAPIAAPTPGAGVRHLADALESSGKTVDDFRGMVGDSPETRVVDMLGTPAARKLRGIRSLGGKPGEVVDEAMIGRQQGQQGRMVDRLYGKRSAEDAFDTAEELTKRQSEKAGPLYDEFRATGVLDLDMHPELKEIVDLPIVKSAIASVKGESRVLSKLPDSDPRVLDAAYKRTGSRAFKALHGHEAGQTQGEFRAALDAASGGKYSPALEAFKGDAALKEALEDGREAFKRGTSAAELTATMKGLSDGERELFQRGAIDALRSDLEEVGNHIDITRRLNNTAFKARVRAVYGDEADDVLKTLAAEAQMAETGGLVRGGSPTVDKAVDAGEVSPEAEGFLRSLAGGNVKQAAIQGATGAWNRMRNPLREAGRTDIANTLLTKVNDPQAMGSLSALLEQLTKQRTGQKAAAGLAGRIGGGAVSR